MKVANGEEPIVRVPVVVEPVDVHVAVVVAVHVRNVTIGIARVVLSFSIRITKNFLQNFLRFTPNEALCRKRQAVSFLRQIVIRLIGEPI